PLRARQDRAAPQDGHLCQAPALAHHGPQTGARAGAAAVYRRARTIHGAMNKKAAGAEAGSAHGGAFTTTRRGPVAARRVATSKRLAREARQRRLAYIALFGVIVVVVGTLVVGAVWQFVISP